MNTTNITFSCLYCNADFDNVNNVREPKYCSLTCYHQSRKLTPARLKERIYSRILKTDSCWLWQGSLNDAGYGVIAVNKIPRRVHRLMFEFEQGALKPSDKVLHSCDNPPCCNPAHLRKGTMADNTRDMVERKRHAHGETTYARLTERDVILIRQDTRPQQEIAQEYGVKRSTIGSVKQGVSWKHLL